MELTPVNPSGRQVIESYGPRGFRVTGVAYARPILVFPDATLEWEVAGIGAVTAETLRPVIERGGTEILLLGCGARMERVPTALRQALKAAGISLEPMDTGAACRTYNVLLAEDRRVAAALLLAA
ncbi:MAG: Mth938-like domain-containing protein [Stellaceae bacterium]